MYRVSAKKAPAAIAWCRKYIGEADYPERESDQSFLAGKFDQWSDKQLGKLGAIENRIAESTGRLPSDDEVSEAGFQADINKKLRSKKADRVPAKPLGEQSDRSRSKGRSEVADKWNVFGWDLLNDERLTLAHVKLWWVILELKWWDQPETKASLDTLAAKTGLHPSTVSQCKKELYEWGFFELSGNSKGGRNQIARYSNMLSFGRYRHGRSSPEEAETIAAEINPLTGGALPRPIKPVAAHRLEARVTGKNPRRQTGVSDAKPSPVGGSRSARHHQGRAINQEAIATTGARAGREPLDPSLSGQVEVEGRKGVSGARGGTLTSTNRAGPAQAGTKEENVPRQSTPAAARHGAVPQSTALPSSSAPRLWVTDFFETALYADPGYGSTNALAEVDHRHYDGRYCYGDLADEFGMDERAVIESAARFRAKVEGTPYPGCERALAHFRRWLAIEDRKGPVTALAETLQKEFSWRYRR